MTSKQILELAPEQIAKLSSKDIPSLVQAAIQLDREIKAAEETLAHYKLRFILEAQSDAAAAEMVTTGTSWNFNSPEGESAVVSFPADALIKSGFIFVKGEAHRYKDKLLIKMGDIRSLAGTAFDKLFAPSYKPAKAFRELVPALIPDATKQRQIIAMVEEPSSPRVSFKTAK